MDDDDDKALPKFNKIVKFDEGYYQVTWPWKNDGFQLFDNHPVAIARLKMLVKHLCSDKNLLHKCDEIIQQQVKSNIIEKVDVSHKSILFNHIILFLLLRTKKSRRHIFFYNASAKAK